MPDEGNLCKNGQPITQFHIFHFYKTRSPQRNNTLRTATFIFPLYLLCGTGTDCLPKRRYLAALPLGDRKTAKSLV